MMEFIQNNKSIIELIVAILAFVIGRYVLPKHKVTIQTAVAEFELLLNYAESFVAYAKQFLNTSGPEKMDNVVYKLRCICEQQGIVVDDETLRAIGQKAYNAMMSVEEAPKIILENAITELKAVSAETLEPIADPNAEQIK